MNPQVKIDTSLIDLDETHALYNSIFMAELTMINTNKRTMRVRVYNIENGEFIYGNVDLPMDVIVDDTFTIAVR